MTLSTLGLGLTTPKVKEVTILLVLGTIRMESSKLMCYVVERGTTICLLPTAVATIFTVIQESMLFTFLISSSLKQIASRGTLLSSRTSSEKVRTYCFLLLATVRTHKCTTQHQSLRMTAKAQKSHLMPGATKTTS